MTLAWLAAAWLAGVAAAATFGRGAWPIALAIAASALAVAVVRRERRIAMLALLLPAVFVAGLVRFDAAQPHLAADAAAHFNDGPDVRLRGVLRDDPAIGDTSQQFELSVREVHEGGVWRRASGGVLVRTALLPRYRAGDAVELEGALDTPPALDGFDYADYLARRGVASVMEYPEVRVTGRDEPGPLRAGTLAVRRRLSHALALSLPEPQASLAQGVLLGQRSALPDDVRDELNATNTSHLVVVSGTNVVLVSSYATMALAWLVGRRRALALSIAAVLAYAMLVGASPPVVRATIMGVLLVCASLAGRPSSGAVSILLAAAAMTGFDPHVVRDVSFQLSFAATAGIVYLAAPLRRWAVELLAWLLRVQEVPRWSSAFVAEPLAVTVAAIAATAPLLALNFERVSLVALPANLLVVPAFPLILGSSLLAALGGLLPHGRLIAAAPAQAMLSYWLGVAGWLAGLPGASATPGGYSTRWAVLSYGALLALALALLRYARPPLVSRIAVSRPLDIRRVLGRAAFAAPVLVLLTGAGFALWPSAPRRLEVTVLDVGQGDAILIETPGGHDVLVDGGPGRAVLRGLGRELPWHDRSIDVVVLTHPQADHAGGLLDVLDRYDVRRALAGPGAPETAVFAAWRRALDREGTQIEVAVAGETIDLGDGVRLEVLWPPSGAPADGNANDAAAVVRVVYGDVAFLLTGDIEAAAERAILASGVDVSATVLKVAHHGSVTSSSARFLAAVRPSVAVISAGRENAYGHPSPGVVERLSHYATIYATGDDGAVHFASDGRTVRVRAGR